MHELLVACRFVIKYIAFAIRTERTDPRKRLLFSNSLNCCVTISQTERCYLDSYILLTRGVFLLYSSPIVFSPVVIISYLLFIMDAYLRRSWFSLTTGRFVTKLDSLRSNGDAMRSEDGV